MVHNEKQEAGLDGTLTGSKVFYLRSYFFMPVKMEDTFSRDNEDELPFLFLSI